MPDEKSPGGSTIRRYSLWNWSKPKVGLSDESARQFAATREKVYHGLFGEPKSILHEVVPLVPHIDIHTYVRSSPEGQVFTLVSSGMSDLPMTIPSNTSEAAPRRVELIFYCSEPKEEYAKTLQWLARFPHDQKTWLSYWHTLPNGDPPDPLWGSEILDTLLFMPTIVNRDQSLRDQLVLGGDPVSFLWVVPLSTPECNLKLEKGFPAILDLFQKNNHPHVFDATRKGYV